MREAAERVQCLVGGILPRMKTARVVVSVVLLASVAAAQTDAEVSDVFHMPHPNPDKK